jgi:MerR family transcriptional regulator, repressor of the yfmOP operon
VDKTTRACAHTYQIDDVAVKTGLTKRALRYYEDLKLITPLRTGSGYRLYSEEDIEKILRIKELRENLGFCLNDIKEFMDLQQNLQTIYSDAKVDIDLVKTSLAMMKTQIELIEEKEQSLARVVIKYQKSFADLNQFYLTLKEGTKKDEKD